MFLGRLFMEHYNIDQMLLEYKLKEISIKKNGVSFKIQVEGF